ncbi:MAG: DUF3307 domain-containing protein [Pseudomonadota bacterium]
MSEYLTIFAALVVGHAIADYPLQGDFLSKAKNRAAAIPGVPWYQALGAHAVMHGGMVWALTGLIWLGLLEMVAHALIDDAKCTGRLSFNQDQSLHLVCKVLWAVAAVTVHP